MNDDLKKEVRKAALQNAVEHDGKTKDKIILSKVLGTAPEFKSRVKEIIPEITLIVSEINNMSLEQQRTEIQNRVFFLQVRVLGRRPASDGDALRG